MAKYRLEITYADGYIAEMEIDNSRVLSFITPEKPATLIRFMERLGYLQRILNDMETSSVARIEITELLNEEAEVIV